VFDTTKIRAIVPDWEARVPFAEGARQIVAWHDADASRRTLDPWVDDAYERLVAL